MWATLLHGFTITIQTIHTIHTQFREIISIFSTKYFIIKDDFMAFLKWNSNHGFLPSSHFIYIVFITYKAYYFYLLSLKNILNCLQRYIIITREIILYIWQQRCNRGQLQVLKLQNLEFKISKIITEFIASITEMALMFYPLCKSIVLPQLVYQGFMEIFSLNTWKFLWLTFLVKIVNFN